MGYTPVQISRIRHRFIDERTSGLSEKPRSGRPHFYLREKAAEIVALKPQPLPEGLSHWSTRELAQKGGGVPHRDPSDLGKRPAKPAGAGARCPWRISRGSPAPTGGGVLQAAGDAQVLSGFRRPSSRWRPRASLWLCRYRSAGAQGGQFHRTAPPSFNYREVQVPSRCPGAHARRVDRAGPEPRVGSGRVPHRSAR